MRETFGTLIQTSRDFATDASSSSTTALTDTQTFLSRQINNTISYLFGKIKNYKTQPVPRTFSTAIGQIYYHNMPGQISLESMVMTIGDTNYPLTPIHSQAEWDKLQQIAITSDIPTYFFPRQHDFGIYPTPSAVRTVAVVGNFIPQRLSVSDYTTGTVAVAQNSASVTGTDTVFTTAMAGRWFCEADSSGVPIGNWYRISSVTNGTTLTLETVFEETALSGSSYLIGQSPELPEELHEYIPFRAASVYYSTIRRDPKRAQELLNFFYTGDFGNPNRGGGITGGVLGVISEYKNKGRGNSQLVSLHKNTSNSGRNEAWTTTLTE